MSEELVSVLARFHREVVLPDIERVVAERVAGLVNPRFDAIDGHFDSVYHRLERLETENAAITAGLGRLEERLRGIEGRLGEVEQRLDTLEAEHRDLVATVRRLDERLSRVEKLVEELVAAQRDYATRSEVQELRARLDGLQTRIDALERRPGR